MKVLICGGGNGAHVMSALTAAQPGCESRVLTLFADEAERWTKAMSKGDFKVTVHALEKDTKVVSAKPKLVSKNPEEVAPDSDLIVLVVPAFAHEGYLTSLKPFIKPGAVLVGLPGQAGFEFQVKGILGDLASHVSVMSFESLPWACRILEFGRHAEVLGIKNSLLGAVQIGSTPPMKDPTEMIQEAVGNLPKMVTTGHPLGISLMSTNAYLHSSIMYGRWHDWDGQPVDAPPLFYNGASQYSANLLSETSDEVLAIAQGIMKAHPQVDLNNVHHIYQWYLRCYEKEIKDKTNLLTCLQTNKAYDNLVHPTTKTSNGKYVPNFKYRYMTEDIPYGLAVMKGIACVVGMPTPNMDKIIFWAQEKLGKEYLTKDGKMEGEDIKETRSPQSFGLTDIDKMLGLA